jgi:hypothetical protein
MAARKVAGKAEGECATGLCPMPSAAQPRELTVVVAQIQELRGEGKTVPEICEALEVSYHVVNQVIQQSYKMAMDTPGVFERQERLRLGLDAE